MTDVLTENIKTIKNSITLLAGNSVYLILNSIGAIILARILSPSDYGLYNKVFIIPYIFYLFCDWGINPSLIYFIAKNQNNTNEIQLFLKNGIVFKFITGFIFTIILYFLSDFFAINILNKSDITAYIKASCSLILFQSLFDTFISIFTGLEKMNIRSMINIFQSLFKSIGAPLLIFLNFGLTGALLGHVISYGLVDIFCLIIIFFYFFDLNINKKIINYDSIKIMIQYGFPLYLSEFISFISLQLTNLLLAYSISDDIFGNYSTAFQFKQMMFVFINSVSIILFPLFSKLSYYKEPDKIFKLYEKTIYYSAFFLVPINLYFIFSSKQIIYLIYTNKYSISPIYLSFMLIPNLLISIGSLTMPRFLNSQGDTNTTLRYSLLSTLLNLILSYFSISYYGIIGLLITNLISGIFINILYSIKINSVYKFKINYNKIIGMLMSSFISTYFSYKISEYLFFNNYMMLLLIESLFLIIFYLTISPLFGTIEKEDIYTVQNLISNKKHIYTIINLMLTYMISLFDVRKKIFKTQ